MNYVDGASISFGMTEDFKIPFEIGSINSVYAINSRELICATSRSFNKIERNEIKLNSTEMKLSASLLIPNTDLFVGIETRTNLLYIFQLADISKPIISKYKTNLHGIFHIYFAPRTSSLVLVGYGIKVFYVNIIYDKQTSNIFPPKITISLRATFCEDFNTPILSPVPFDPDHELLFLPTPKGICQYDMDGNKKDLMSSYPASITTLYCYNKYSRKMFTFEPNQGLILWSQGALVESTFASAGTSLFAIFLVDEENLVCLNGMNQLFLLNFISGRIFFCHSFEKRPSRLFMVRLFNKPYIIVCHGATLRAIKIDVPWKVWNYPLLNCYSITRCNKLNEAGRILVQTNFNAINLYAPSRGSLISSATPNIASTPISFFYDRGFIQLAKRDGDKYDLFNLQTNSPETQNFEDLNDNMKLKDSNRDIIYFIFNDGTIIGYYTGVSPCEPVIKLSLKAHFLLIVNYNDAWCYATVSEKGLLGIYNYYTFEQITQLNIYQSRVLKAFYEPLSQSVICVTECLTLIYNLKSKTITDQFEITGTTTVSLFGDFLKYGYKSGHITTVYLNNGQFDHNNIIDNRPHSSQVTGFSFSQENWISTSLDCKLLVWNYHEEMLYQVLLPLPLYACCIYNGYKNIIVATESEIMSINTELMFHENEKEIKEIDNYDRLIDYLDRQHLMQSLLRMNSSKNSVKSETKSEAKIKPNLSFDALINDEKNKKEQSILIPKEKPKKENKPKPFNQIDDKKKIEAMMKMNGIKAPVNIMKFANMHTPPKQKEEETEKVNNNQKIEMKNETKPKTNLSSSSPKDFIAKAMQEENDEANKKKIRKKKIVPKENNQIVEEPKRVDLQKTMDLLNLMDKNNNNNLLRTRKRSKTVAPPKKPIDIAALAKQFEKIPEPENKKESEYEYTESSESEEEKRKKKIVRKRSNTQPKKVNSPKNKSESTNRAEIKPAPKKVDSNTKKFNSNVKKVDSNTKIPDTNVKKSDSNNKNEMKVPKAEKQIKRTKPAENIKPKNEEKSKKSMNKIVNDKVSQLLIPQPKSEVSEDEATPKQKPKQKKKTAKVNKKSDKKPVLLNIATQGNDFNSEQNDKFTQNEIIKNDQQSEIEEESPNDTISDTNDEVNSIEINDYNDINSEYDNNENENENQILEVKNVSNLESSSSDFQSNIELDNPTNIPTQQNEEKKPKIHYNPGTFQKKFKPTKPIQYAGRQQTDFKYRPAKQFTFTINHKGKIEDIRPKRPGTPDPDSKNSKSIAIRPKKQIRRCFSYLPKKQQQPIFDFSINNIPANIWIDDNALFEKYSVRRSLNNGQMKSAICLDDRVKRNNVKSTKSIKSPPMPRSNFFIRNKRSNNEENDEEMPIEQIDDKVQKLQLRHFQLHEYQRSFQYLQSYKQYEQYDQYKKQPNNHSNSFNSNIQSRPINSLDSNYQIQPPFSIYTDQLNLPSKSPNQNQSKSPYRFHQFNSNQSISINPNQFDLYESTSKNQFNSNQSNFTDQFNQLDLNESKSNNKFDSNVKSKSNSNLMNQFDSNSLIRNIPNKSIEKNSYQIKLKVDNDNQTFSFYNSDEIKQVNNDNEEFVIKQPPVKQETKQNARKSFLNKVSQINNSIRTKEPRYDMEMGRSVATIEANENVDRLEEAFMRKMPFFEMKKNKNNYLNKGRSSSARRISKPKLYLNPVYPPNNRNPTIDSAVIRSTKNYYY